MSPERTIMGEWENYKLGETESLRIEGTEIGKAAVREFARGLRLRQESPYEPVCVTDQDRASTAAFYFFKWLSEVPGYGCVSNDLNNKILTAWMTPEDEFYFVSNMLGCGGKPREAIACRDIICHLHTLMLFAARPRRGSFRRLRFWLRWCWSLRDMWLPGGATKE